MSMREMHEVDDTQQLSEGNSWWVRLLDKSLVALAHKSSP